MESCEVWNKLLFSCSWIWNLATTKTKRFMCNSKKYLMKSKPRCSLPTTMSESAQHFYLHPQYKILYVWPHKVSYEVSPFPSFTLPLALALATGCCVWYWWRWFALGRLCFIASFLADLKTPNQKKTIMPNNFRAELPISYMHVKNENCFAVEFWQEVFQ